MTKAELAVSKYRNGYNCCQAVACSFAEEVGIDESVLFKMCEAFGAGMGTGRAVCGAMSGVAILTGLVNSNGDIEHPGQTKAMSTRTAGQLLGEFEKKVGAIYCKDIKAEQKTSCADCIANAVEIVEKII